ncbi:MAG: hypothetical protein AAGJ18_08340, partial [Bacteroidota bacterium]
MTSSKPTDNQRTLSGDTVFTGVELEIWIADSQSSVQNKVDASAVLEDLMVPTCSSLPNITDVCSNYQSGNFGGSTDVDGDGQFDDGEYVPLSGGFLETVVDETAPIVSITTPSVCINGEGFDAAPYGEEDFTPGTAPFECDEIKIWTAQVTDNCDSNLTVTGKLFENDNLVVDFTGTTLYHVVEPNINYEVRFTATDDFGNTGTSTQQNIFFDCVRPVVLLQGSNIYSVTSA